MSLGTPDERAEEKIALREAQSLPLNSDGSLNIAGFHLRDAAHRRLAVELVREIVAAILPSPEAVARKRHELHNNNANNTSANSIENDSFASGSFGNFGSVAGSGSGGLTRKDSMSGDHMRTRTRTVKLTNVEQHASSVQEAAEQLRPFVSQLLLYPECADEISRSLGDVFVKFVRACATSGDASCTVEVFVRWLSALTLRYTVDACLDACELVLQFQQLAKRIRRSGVIQPVEIARMIRMDIVQHLEDESTWYPAARMCLCRLYLAPSLDTTTAQAATESNINTNNSLVTNDSTATAVTPAAGCLSPEADGDVAANNNNNNNEAQMMSSSCDSATAVANMVQGDSNLCVRRTALGELTRWLRNSSASTDLVERSKLCLGAVQSLFDEGTGSLPSSFNSPHGQQQRPQHQHQEATNEDGYDENEDSSNSNSGEQQQQQQQQRRLQRGDNRSMWSVSDSLRYACIPLVLAVCEKVHTAGRQNNASGLSLLQEAANFALRFAGDPSWRVRYQIATCVSEFAAFPGCNTAHWVRAATLLATDTEPSIRAAIAASAADIFLSGGRCDLVSTALPIVLALARDSDASVRCAVVKSFFVAWSQLGRHGGGEQRQQQQQIKEREKQLEHECHAEYHKLLFDTAENVRVVALESLNSLGELLKEEDVLEVAVHAVVVAVGGRLACVGNNSENDQHEEGTFPSSLPDALAAFGDMPIDPEGGGGAMLNPAMLIGVAREAAAATATNSADQAAAATPSSRPQRSGAAGQEDEHQPPPPPRVVFTSQSAGKWQVRKLGAEQFPLLAAHMPLVSFKHELWPCLQQLLSDPTSAVREQVIYYALPAVMQTYGAVAALSATEEWIVPLIKHPSYQRRRAGFLALAQTAKSVLAVVKSQDSSNNNKEEQATAAAKNALKKIVADSVQAVRADSVALVREAVEAELSGNSVLADLVVKESL